MKQVSYKVAKILKKAGYPQNRTISHYTDCGELICYGIAGETGFDIPSYLEVWLWLWREKEIYIEVEGEFCTAYSTNISTEYLYRRIYKHSLIDPEEAITSAIEYLADNDLIK